MIDSRPQHAHHQFILCEEHGRKEWKGDIQCAPEAGGCGRVWNVDEERLRPGPQLGTRCLCGAELSVAEARKGYAVLEQAQIDGRTLEEHDKPPPYTPRIHCADCALEWYRAQGIVSELGEVLKRADKVVELVDVEVELEVELEVEEA
jgi:hypothetical protein